MKLTVDLGSEQRTILSGLKKERSDPSALEGMQALFVVNLEPRKMAGDVSHGMLFDVGYADGIYALSGRSRGAGARRDPAWLTGVHRDGV